MDQTFWKPSSGEVLEGIYLNKGTQAGKYGVDDVILIDAVDGSQVVVVLRTMLKSLFTNIAKGSVVRIRFNGVIQEDGKHPYNHYTLWKLTPTICDKCGLKGEPEFIEVRKQKKVVSPSMPDKPAEKNTYAKPTAFKEEKESKEETEPVGSDTQEPKIS
jgi:hypothetical protein